MNAAHSNETHINEPRKKCEVQMNYCAGDAGADEPGPAAFTRVHE